MNDDLISRSELKKAVENLVAGGEERLIEYYKNGSKSEENEWIGGIYDAWEEIIDAPTIEVRDNFDVGYVQGLEDGRKEKTHGEWIPVSERLPDDETEVLIQFQYGNSMMVGYYMFDSTVYPSEFEDENETGWYDSNDNFICGSDEVIAWMPLSEPYKEAENE